jgi:uncharacterized protein
MAAQPNFMGGIYGESRAASSGHRGVIAALTAPSARATLARSDSAALSRDPPLIQRLAVLAAVLSLVLAAPAQAETASAASAPACQGRDLIAALAPAARDSLRATADAVPFARGNYWRAIRDGAQVTLLGTYHLDDPRHDGLVQTAGPVLDQATTLLVEAGSKEEAELMALLARDPAAILAPEGPTLAETLPDAEWQQLAQAMRDRGIPPFMASRFRAWYVTMLLSVPPCAMKQATAGNGLDKRMIARAEAAGIPVMALEPFDTALKLFDQMDAEAQMAMIRSTLALEDQAEDQMATLSATYFGQESRLIWEYSRLAARDLPGMTPEQVDAEFATMEDALMNTRNRAWIPVIEAAAAKGPVFAAFGALHLSGDQGVLALLQARGWTIERLPLP